MKDKEKLIESLEVELDRVRVVYMGNCFSEIRDSLILMEWFKVNESHIEEIRDGVAMIETVRGLR